MCPHCRIPSLFIRVANPYTEHDRGGFYYISAVMQCQACLALILGTAKHFPNDPRYEYVEHFPLGSPDDRVAAEIPDNIKSDFKEAIRCLWVDAYNATAEMCRRAIEASCINLGAPKSERWLEDKIDWLADQRKITPFLQQVAHKIRLGGNRAAHPPHIDPQPQGSTVSAEELEPQITKDHAEAIVKFAREFFHHVYVVPKQLEQYDFSKPKTIATAATPPPAKKGP